MTITIPSELDWALRQIGCEFPDADEDKLEEMGRTWTGFADTLRGLVDEVDKPAQAVWTGNQGKAIDAFQQCWTGPEAPSKNLRDGAEAAAMIGAGFGVAATVVVALKLLVLEEAAQFLALCIATAAAAETIIGGIIGLAAVVAKRIIAQKAIDAAIEYAIEKLTS
jgi:hypothetical protein